jgi:cyclic-di-GMP-binding biofilm dispersal mediator protein
MAERELQGAVVAVVGASGGLGSAVCAELTARGATVVACGPHPERIAAAGVAAAAVVELDLRDPSAGDALVAAVADLGGRLDGLVNAAGVVAFGDLVDTDDAVIEELFLTDVVGPLWLLKRVVPLLSESKGFVVQLSAVVAEQPMAGMAAYSSAKAALTAADTALTRELRRKGITVCDVRPPHTETGLADRPIAGEAPRLKEGLSPSTVATAVVDAIAAGATEVPAVTFTA